MILKIFLGVIIGAAVGYGVSVLSTHMGST